MLDWMVYCISRFLHTLYYCFITGPIASIFWLDKELGSDIFLDGM